MQTFLFLFFFKKDTATLFKTFKHKKLLTLFYIRGQREKEIIAAYEILLAPNLSVSCYSRHLPGKKNDLSPILIHLVTCS